VAQAAGRHGKLAAMQPANLKQAREWLAMGLVPLSWKTDIALYRAALANEVDGLRKLLSTRGV
jgi:2-keto-3-deoxy-L-rhamnonate aldolase RhmA